MATSAGRDSSAPRHREIDDPVIAMRRPAAGGNLHSQELCERSRCACQARRARQAPEVLRISTDSAPGVLES